MSSIHRRKAIRNIVTGSATLLASGSITEAFAGKNKKKKVMTLKGNINHSVCQWCYNTMPLEDLVKAAKEIGIKSVELLQPNEWAVAQKHGLTCAMGYAASMGLNKGFNDPSLHAQLLADYATNIPKAAEAGLKN